jgi:hypothetical protein
VPLILVLFSHNILSLFRNVSPEDLILGYSGNFGAYRKNETFVMILDYITQAKINGVKDMKT